MPTSVVLRRRPQMGQEEKQQAEQAAEQEQQGAEEKGFIKEGLPCRVLVDKKANVS